MVRYNSGLKQNLCVLSCVILIQKCNRKKKVRRMRFGHEPTIQRPATSAYVIGEI